MKTLNVSFLACNIPILNLFLKKITIFKKKICFRCPQTFSSNWYLKDHVNRIHLGLKVKPSFECEVCGKFLRGRKSLENHISAIHKGFKNHICHICKCFIIIMPTLLEIIISGELSFLFNSLFSRV